MVPFDIDIRNYLFVAVADIVAVFVEDDFVMDVDVDIDTNVDFDFVVGFAEDDVEQNTAELEIARIVVIDSSGPDIAYLFAEVRLVSHFDDVVASTAVGIETVAIYTCHFDYRLEFDSALTLEAQHDFDCNMVAETSNVVVPAAVGSFVEAPAVVFADRASASYWNDSAGTEQVN